VEQQKIVNNFPPLIEALLKSEAYGHRVASIQTQETHISWVLLTGQFAYKIKKPVKFAFLDFSTLEKRHFYCQEELRLNQRLAPDLYLGLVPITGTPQEPHINGSGVPIEYAIKMRQFPVDQLLSDLAARKEITTDLLEQLVKKIAGFHLLMAQADAATPYGNTQSIRHWFDENISCIQPLLDDPGQLQRLRDIQIWAEQEWQLKSELIRQRKEQGFVRECHGDLHLGNITMIDGQPVMFDCIEFNPELRWIDVINEMAFLVLDLLHFSCGYQANWLLNRYLQLTGDYGGLGVLRFYLVYKALVRAKLSLLKGLQRHGRPEQQTAAEYQSYIDLTGQFTQPNRPALIITHGFSGSGKSFVSRQLAARIGAIQIRSDIERKRLFGYREHDNTCGGIYSPEANRQTYEKLCELAKIVNAAGYTVIVDAAFLKKWERALFRQLAADCLVRFAIISFTAPERILRERIDQRTDDASEATVAVLEMQLQIAQPLSTLELKESVVIETSRETTETSVAKLATWVARNLR